MFKKRVLNSMIGTIGHKPFLILIIGVLLFVFSSPMSFAQAVTDSFNHEMNNRIPATRELADHIIYLPVVMKNFPFTPNVPVLDAISNEDGDGNYTVSWSSSEGATIYTLQEDNNANFSSSTTVYSGPGTSTTISGRDVETYFYRVMASNSYASSDWSNVASVVVTVTPPDCPQTGNWVGATSQGRDIGFDVENLPQCQIASDTLKIEFRDSCGVIQTTTFMYSTTIVNNSFDTGVSSAGTRVVGEFPTTDTASGTFSYSAGSCTASGTWTAVFNKWANNSVGTIVLQADGKILVSGDFSTLLGEKREHIGRLNADGTLDTTFNPGANGWITSMVLQSDHKIVVGGYFTSLGGQTRNYIGRLNPDGTLDTTFNPGADAYVSALAIQQDDKILVGGNFTTLSGQVRNYIGRLNPDGTLDSEFNPGADDRIIGLGIQPNGQILVGGWFDEIAGQPRDGIARLNPSGTIDDSFSASAPGTRGFDFQSEDKILIWGYIVLVNGQYRPGMARLDSDGTLDLDFNPQVSYNVHALVQQPDGNILVGGDFDTSDGAARDYLVRFHADGTLDSSFSPQPNDYVRSVVVLPDGKIMVGGDFTTLGGETYYYIGRLNPDGTPDATFP